MKTIGIICEYNPFHNGHWHHIKEIKRMYPDSLIVLVMSGNFTQRGQISLLNKWDKTKIALEHNIDLVVELPFFYATEGADVFAQGSVQLLNELQVDTLVFGSESNDVNTLISLAQKQLNNKEYNDSIKKHLDEGSNYPTALAKSLKELYNININTPNDILGLTYIREIISNNFNIQPVTIKRTNDFHSFSLQESITSATSIRKALLNKEDITRFVPHITYEFLKQELPDIDKYFSLLRYRILTSTDLSKYKSVDEGIENRIRKYIKQASSWDELVSLIKTKRYTFNRINRILIHILCGFEKSFQQINYIRILGFSHNGQKHLNKIKKSASLPIISNYSSQTNNELFIDDLVSKIYSLGFSDENKYYSLELIQKPIKKQ